MKLRYTLPIIFLPLLLASCNLTLAEDVTPPPNYIPPTPMPTLVLIPEQIPNVANGAAIYAEKCAPCHGETGLGDGEQGIQLGVTVKAFGLSEVARPASPAQYFTTVTRGNMERFMPPFNSLNDQQRWDVIAYVLTLHATPEQIEQGKKIFETNCAGCSTDLFKNQEKMAKLSEVELARLAREGNDEIPAFGSNLNDDDLWAIAAYLRSLSFDTTPRTQIEAVSPTQTPVASGAETPSAEGTPVGTEQATAGGDATQVVQPGFGTVSGIIINNTGTTFPSDLTISLYGFEHGTGENAGAQEVLTQAGTVNPDGTYAFENIEIPEGRIFLVEVTYSGITMQSEAGIVKSGDTSVSIAPIMLYSITEDTSALVIDELHLFFQEGSNNSYEILALYNFRNPTDKVIAVNMTADQQEIPFLKFISGAQALGYEAAQDGAPLIGLDSGFAMRPNEQPYSIMAFSSVPKQERMTISQEFALPASAVRVFVPSGMKVKGEGIAAESTQDIQGSAYEMYTANNIKPGASLTFEVSGSPVSTETTGAETAKPNTLVYGAIAAGFALILAGGWTYWRDRNRAQDEDEEEEEEAEDEEDEFESSEEVLDAILALDDLHRAKKISEDAYHKRRTELKDALKGLM